MAPQARKDLLARDGGGLHHEHALDHLGRVRAGVRARVRAGVRARVWVWVWVWVWVRVRVREERAQYRPGRAGERLRRRR